MPIPTLAKQVDSCFSFVKNGLSTWKKALETFERHEQSDLHRASVVAVHNNETNLSVLAQMATGREAQMMKNRIVLSKIFTSLQYLGCQGVAVRGKFDKDSNLIALLEERKNDIMTSLN